MGVVTYRKSEFEVINRLQSTPIFSPEKHLRSVYKAIFSSEEVSEAEVSKPSKAYLHQTRYHVLSIPDLVEESRLLVNATRPIIVLNFHARDDEVYIGTSDFAVTDLKVEGLLFKKIRATLASGTQ